MSACKDYGEIPLSTRMSLTGFGRRVASQLFVSVFVDGDDGCMAQSRAAMAMENARPILHFTQSRVALGEVYRL